MNTTLNIGLAGLGTVGGGLVRLLSENAEEIRARSGCGFNLKAVAVRNPNRKRDLPEGVRLTADPMALADDPDIDVVIELMGGIDMSFLSGRTAVSSRQRKGCGSSEKVRHGNVEKHLGIPK